MTSETPGPPLVPIPILNRETLPALFAIVDRLEAALGLPPRVLDTIFHEDDWSFVVKGLTQVQLAKRAKVTRGYLAQLKAGYKVNPSLPSLPTLRKLAKALGVPVTELLG